MKESIYIDLDDAKEDFTLLEEEKKAITAKNSELTSSIDKLEAEIEKTKHKLKFSKDLEIITSESVGKYSLPHLILVFLIGISIGYYILG